MPLNNPPDVSGVDGIVQASGTVYYANANSGNDSNDGTTPDLAFLTIIYAVSQMSAGGVRRDSLARDLGAIE